MAGRFEPAMDALQGYLNDQPNGPLASRASFLIAKAHLGLGQFDDARQQFEVTIQKFPQSAEAHKSQYKLAVLSLMQGDKDDARRRFIDLTSTPSGTLVPEATAWLKTLDAQAKDAAKGAA